MSKENAQNQKIEEVVKQLKELCFLSELTLSEIDVDKDQIEDLDKVLNNFVKIDVVSNDLLDSGIATDPFLKETYIQMVSVSEFIQEIAGQLNEDGSSTGNNDLKYISNKLKDIRDYSSSEVARISKLD